MPELPEVEVTRLGLIPLLNLKINKVIIRNYSLRWPIPQNLKDILINQVLIKLSRRGKYILAEFTSGTLIIHLGMSGRICITKKNELYAYKHHGFWQPMDTIAEKKYLEELYASNSAPWKVWK